MARAESLCPVRSMQTIHDPVPIKGMSSRFDDAHKVLFVFGFAAPIATFVFAVSDLSISQKTVALIAISAVYATICIWAYIRSARMARLALQFVKHSEAGSGKTGDKLHALEEANQFFGSSLKPADMFRLVSSRVRDIFPFETAVLFVPDETSSRLNAAFADGPGSDRLANASGEIGAGLAGMAFLSAEIEVDEGLQIERTVRDRSVLAALGSAAAVPLLHNGEVFAVYQIYLADEECEKEGVREILKAVGERIAPLFLSSRAFERSLSNALTDPLTDLPNERAFFMVLENQVAESQRFREDRPLSVVAVDIKGFDAANQRFGHATGDRLLRFTGQTLRMSLRKMDFLARGLNDEFAIILPTATEKMAADIVERIKEDFAATPFQISEHESTKLWLNFGSATFWKDGETSNQLIQAARLRKQQSKSEDPSNVLWFDKEYVN